MMPFPEHDLTMMSAAACILIRLLQQVAWRDLRDLPRQVTIGSTRARGGHLYHHTNAPALNGDCLVVSKSRYTCLPRQRLLKKVGKR